MKSKKLNIDTVAIECRVLSTKQLKKLSAYDRTLISSGRNTERDRLKKEMIDLEKAAGVWDQWGIEYVSNELEDRESRRRYFSVPDLDARKKLMKARLSFEEYDRISLLAEWREAEHDLQTAKERASKIPVLMPISSAIGSVLVAHQIFGIVGGLCGLAVGFFVGIEFIVNARNLRAHEVERAESDLKDSSEQCSKYGKNRKYLFFEYELESGQPMETYRNPSFPNLVCRHPSDSPQAPGTDMIRSQTSIAELERDRAWRIEIGALTIYRDENQWCVVKPDFVDLATSDAWFDSELIKAVRAATNGQKPEGNEK